MLSAHCLPIRLPIPQRVLGDDHFLHVGRAFDNLVGLGVAETVPNQTAAALLSCGAYGIEKTLHFTEALVERGAVLPRQV